MRGGKVVTLPTDFSQVVDLSGGPAAEQLVAAGRAQRHTVPGWAGLLAAYTLLPAHPGLLVLPAAVPLQQQLDLVRDALSDFPDPPARTNNDLHFGPLEGVWRAAQLGLRLNWERRDSPHGGTGGAGVVGGTAGSWRPAVWAAVRRTCSTHMRHAGHMRKWPHRMSCRVLMRPLLGSLPCAHACSVVCLACNRPCCHALHVLHNSVMHGNGICAAVVAQAGLHAVASVASVAGATASRRHRPPQHWHRRKPTPVPVRIGLPALVQQQPAAVAVALRRP